MRRAWPTLLSLLLAVACGGSAAVGPTDTIELRPLPEDAGSRRAALDDLGRRTFEALRDGVPRRLLVPARELDLMLTPGARHRLERLRGARNGAVPNRLWAGPWRDASYQGFCAQSAREEGEGGPTGLRASAWIVERMLIVAKLGSQLSASWVEGTFVHTSGGFLALILTRLEGPRAGHSDLELAPCDVESGVR